MPGCHAPLDPVKVLRADGGALQLRATCAAARAGRMGGGMNLKGGGVALDAW